MAVWLMMSYIRPVSLRLCIVFIMLLAQMMEGRGELWVVITDREGLMVTERLNQDRENEGENMIYNEWNESLFLPTAIAQHQGR